MITKEEAKLCGFLHGDKRRNKQSAVSVMLGLNNSTKGGTNLKNNVTRNGRDTSRRVQPWHEATAVAEGNVVVNP